MASSCVRTTTRTAGSSPRCARCPRTSSRTRRPDRRSPRERPWPRCHDACDPRPGHHRMILAFQALLALAYTVLAHLSNALDRPGLGAIALALLALVLLLAPMARRRWWARLALPRLWLGGVVLYCHGLVRGPVQIGRAAGRGRGCPYV